jgi:predicted nucleotidyltransferase component of viral defense system
MNRNSPYYRQVSLLIRCLPLISEEDCFALKGGTAINLFVQDFPRLSVDIDLAYLPFEPRQEALENIRNRLRIIAERIENTSGLSATLQDNNPDEMRIIVSSSERGTSTAQIKIEVSPVSRGTLFEPSQLDVVNQVEDEFGFATINVVSIADLYGGKLCAALDRQHPRDLFDVAMLLKSRGIDRLTFDGFLAYLLSHNRPISEIMDPRWKEFSGLYNNEFSGMTFQEFSLEELNQVPLQMISALKAHFTQKDYDFLASFKSGNPNWSLTTSENLHRLPAVQWKLLNIQKMSSGKRENSLAALKSVMSDWLSQ